MPFLRLKRPVSPGLFSSLHLMHVYMYDNIREFSVAIGENLASIIYVITLAVILRYRRKSAKPDRGYDTDIRTYIRATN